MHESVAVSGLYLYPVKSLRGVAVEAAALTNGRFVGDREFVVVHRDGHFMHQRDYPQMARVEADITATALRLGSPGFADLHVSRRHESLQDPILHVRLWRRSAPVTTTSREADEWISDVLGAPCRLMAFVAGAAALGAPSYEVHSSLQDAAPFHLVTEESVADLNARTRSPVPVIRFRPNIVVRGATPYAEDNWKTVTVADTVLRWVKACTRCVMTTTDHITGERMGHEPLATLSRYRRHFFNVVFGHYFMAERWGAAIRVGDAVSVDRSNG